jgi:hypothetical protein
MKSILVVAALGAAGALGPVDTSSSRAEAREVARIRSHFDSVLVELGNADVSRLDASQRAHRSTLVATLRGYRARGVFPHNYDFAAPTPYFIDRKTGTLCAVAFLMESTGRRAMVNRIAAADNNVWVAALEGDREVASWLSQNGLTLAEAARIQVPYVGGPTPPPPQPPPPAIARYNQHATIAGIASIGTTLLSIDGDPAHASKRYAVGALVGVVAVVMGRSTSDVRPDQGPRNLTLIAGATSVGIAALRMTQRGALQQAAARKALDIQPTANVIDRSAGLTVALRF